MTPPDGEALRAALAGSYRIKRELGRGGMATVWLAHDLRHDRPVALKLLHAELASVLGPDRFLREIRLAARLQHPHILTVLDSGDAGGRLWYTMPYVEGETLRQRLTRERQLAVADALRITGEVADALDYAHRHGVIHRDIKPENILLAGAHALVADFGIAKADGRTGDRATGREQRLTETGLTLGTPAYMSPEQAAGDRDLDARTDIYSLGCVLYEMLAGEPPYTGATQQAVLAKRLTEPVPRVSTLRQVSPAVEQAVTRALARAPADRFTTAADFAAALTSADSVPTVVTPPAVRRAGPPIRLRLLLGAAAAVLLVATAIFAWRDRPAPAPARQAPPASAAVLPFTNLSADKDQEYFSDGLTEELITALSQVPGLRVAPRSSSFQFKGREPDVREVGRMLDVGTVLEGSVRRSGNRLRVSAQLVSVKQNSQLWAESYDRDLADVFAVQEDIARAIVAALRVRLAPDRPTVVASPTRDLEAYDLYLKGRFAWNQRTAASLPQAARYFEQAVGRDSGMARGYAGLADAELLLPLYTDAKPEAEWPRAKAAALRALALDSTLADAHTSLAYGTLLYEWNWRAAEASFGRAIASDSAYATAHHWYADFLAGRGRLDESLREMRRAHQLDPLSRIVATELAWVQYLQHRTADARAEIDRVLALDPGFAHAYFVRGLIELQAGRPVEAVASFRRNIEIGGFYAYTNGVLCYALARSGDRAAAERELAEMLARRKTQYVPPFGLAMAYAGLGDRSQAIGWLERGIAERDILMPENFFDPLFDSLVGDPRFAAVERRLGLTPRKAGR